MTDRIRTLKEAEEFLSGLSVFGIRLGLETITALCARLGNPQNAYPSVLIAGTNGKGSVCAVLSSILKNAGYKTGLYTSPHLVDVKERIKINDEMIAAGDFVSLLNAVVYAGDELISRGRISQYPTYFELLTALAFLWFAHQKVDIAVLEIGLGGRFDAVNIVNPLVSVITDIDLDHQKHLGRTIREIAGEKAGIIRDNGILVSSVSKKQAKEVLTGTAESRKSDFIDALREVRVKVIETPYESVRTRSGVAINPVRGKMEKYIDVIDVQTPENLYKGIVPSLTGRHQFRNISAAVRAAEILKAKDYRITSSNIIHGIENARWKGRLEWVDWKIPILLDGAHNPAGIRSLAAYIKDKIVLKDLALVFACKTSKDYEKICFLLRRIPGRIFLPVIGGYQFVEPSIIKEFCIMNECQCEVVDSLDAVFMKVDTEVEFDYMLATGSLNFVGEIKKYFNKA